MCTEIIIQIAKEIQFYHFHIIKRFFWGCKSKLLVSKVWKKKSATFLIRSSDTVVKISDKLFTGLDAKLWRISAELVGGILDSFTRLW